MAKKENNGQKQTSPVENIIFNSANGFVESGIKFDGAIHEVMSVINLVGANVAKVKFRNREHKLKLKYR